jgi:hypothetical protein
VIVSFGGSNQLTFPKVFLFLVILLKRPWPNVHLQPLSSVDITIFSHKEKVTALDLFLTIFSHVIGETGGILKTEMKSFVIRLEAFERDASLIYPKCGLPNKAGTGSFNLWCVNYFILQGVQPLFYSLFILY